MVLVCIMLFQNVSYAFVNREIEVVSKKIIPFSFVSDTQFLEENLSIKGLSNVEITKTYVDNGKITARVENNRIEVDFDEGEWINNSKTITKIGSLKLQDVILTNAENKIGIIDTDENIKEIREVSGDFESANILSGGKIEIKVKDEATGELGYDESCLEKSTVNVNIDNKNLTRKVYSDEIVLPHEIVGDIKPKSGDTSNVYGIYADKNTVKVLFDNGEPEANENSVNAGYTYFWIDRQEDGTFKRYNPNSVYSTDINKITGLGEYIDKTEFSEIGLTISDKNWTDYCGIEKNGVRYIYVFDETKGIPKKFDGNLISEDRISFEGQEFNTEKFFVEFSNAGVSYIPEGKLYSMGELVKNTAGWGEVAPNRDWESTKTFLNEYTGKLETYVKHFKFFYGPDEKKTFGGYYTYPYSCVFEYEHYKPVNKFSGEIVYEYESEEDVTGYLYNGWVEIQYTETKNVDDYPPTEPFNVKYNAVNGNITWSAGDDDYTKKEDLKYEVQIFDGTWKTIAKNQFSELLINYKIDYIEPDVRIRTIDEVGQISDWAYATESDIELIGELKPYIVKPGDTIDIFSTTKSFEKIQSVTAKNDEMQMYAELEKVKESVPSFFEMSYDIEADFFDSSTDALAVTNGRAALGSKDIKEAYNYVVRKSFTKGHVEFDLIEDVEIQPNGSCIFSNINYDDIPVDIFTYDSKVWHASFYNQIYIHNKVKDKEDVLFKIESDVRNVLRNNKYVIVPEYTLQVNKFEYDENDNPTYECIDVDKNLVSHPVCMTWETDAEGVTTVYIYLGDTFIYSYETLWKEFSSYVDKFDSLYMYKQMKRYSRASYGYTTYSKTIKAKWNKIAGSFAINRDLRDFLWLGYRVRKNEYVKEEYVDGYNANPKVRNNYRLLISDDCMSKKAIKRYMDILKAKNITMTKDKDTVFGDDVMEYTSAFQGNNIGIPKETLPGKYIINLTATDVSGNSAEYKLTLIVQESDNKDNEKDVSNVVNDVNVEDMLFGRFFYREDKGYLEELKKTEKNSDTSGFICAGETLGFSLATENVDYIEVDFLGDESIKKLDDLTKKFLIDIPKSNGKDVSDIMNQYAFFPQKVYPHVVDKSGKQLFKWFYTIPYRTTQTLESWSSLKNGTLEDINISKLFDRRNEPYELVIYLNGDVKSAIHLSFDVFERWDTILNRDVTKYVINSDTRLEMRIDK